MAKFLPTGTPKHRLSDSDEDKTQPVVYIRADDDDIDNFLGTDSENDQEAQDEDDDDWLSAGRELRMDDNPWRTGQHRPRHSKAMNAKIKESIKILAAAMRQLSHIRRSELKIDRNYSFKSLCTHPNTPPPSPFPTAESTELLGGKTWLNSERDQRNRDISEAADWKANNGLW
jgi:hypothetical protein